MRLLVLAAFAAVIVAGLKIYHEFQDDKNSGSTAALELELTNLQKSGEELAADLERLSPDSNGMQARLAAHRALADQRKAIAALHRRQQKGQDVPQEAETQAALNAEFDWLDGVETILSNPKSPLLKVIGQRGEAAISAFDRLDEDRGVALTIRGAAKLTTWAKAHRSS
ncbi:MAG: hypothetical protein QOF76_3135 [Solirubrobacteraceae bacterium]|nr:hypothetical protein [Solirubrobacteraceae bacterium]